MNESFAERLYNAGFTDLISVIPPGAQLMPSSKIPQASVGKIPGRRHTSGLWAGYNWRADDASVVDVRKWVSDGANIGLRATNFPGVDIDCSEPQLAKMIEDAVRGQLGNAPVRTGRAPKRLLMYKTAEPFSRMRLWITKLDGTKHIIEILGEGQQYLVNGMHPSGSMYSWDIDPTTVDLVTITAEQAAMCLDYIEQLVDIAGIGTTKREGDGRRSTRTAASDQTGLLAPSLEALQLCVSKIPNSDEIFPTRADYLKIGYAIRAAVGAERDEDGFDLFAEWASRWDGGTNDPDVVRDDYKRMTPPYSVGWNFLAETARSFGYNDAAEEFSVEAVAPEAAAATEDPAAPLHSDQWLAEAIIDLYRGVLRYIPQKGTWVVWDGARWVVDAELAGEDLIFRGLKGLANTLLRQGATAEEKARNLVTAKGFCTAGKATAVAQIVRASRAVAVSLESLDLDPWILNTPAGIVDLKTGKLTPPDPDALVTKMTAVAPDFTSPTPEWDRFIAEATGGNTELAGFIQRYAGYCLTGSIEEEQLLFVFGPGSNGKTVMTNVLAGVLGDYARTASMDTFVAGFGEKHTTDLAMLVGSRLVTASETTSGKRWDDQRIKSLTGGEKVTARFMRQDNFTYTPQFKLLFIGNHQPELRDVDKAMRRRIHMVPFLVAPKVIDKQLSEKLKAEWPAILAWMVRGCLDWQAKGLVPPAVVTVATEEYFENEDAYGAWIKECCTLDPQATATTQELFQSWQEWSNPRNDFVGSTKRFSQAMVSRGFTRWRHPESRRMGFEGIKLIQGSTEIRVS